MMTSEDANSFNVTCLDCKKSKSYFTAQGVNFFKLNHQGHQVKVDEPANANAPQETPPKPNADPAKPIQQSKSVPVSMDNIVVDVVDEENGRVIKVYGIAAGQEKFARTYGVTSLAELNTFLESGRFDDSSSKTAYLWSPDRIDLSDGVARALDRARPSPVSPSAQTVEAPMAETRLVPKPGLVEKVEPSAPALAHSAPKGEAHPPETAPSPTGGEPLLAGTSYVQEGDRYRQESLRVSNALREFTGDGKTPYVIGSLFDELLSVRSQTGGMNAGAIEAVTKLGYGFVAVEVSGGIVTAWFKRKA